MLPLLQQTNAPSRESTVLTSSGSRGPGSPSATGEKHRTWLSFPIPSGELTARDAWGPHGKNKACRAAPRRAPQAPDSGRHIMTDLSTITNLHPEYAKQLLHLSELIVGAVHDPMNLSDLPNAIDRALAHPAPFGVDTAVALAAVLAAQIDPDSTATQRLARLQIIPASVNRDTLPTPRQVLQSVLGYLADDDGGRTIPVDSLEFRVVATVLGRTRLREVPLAYRGVPVELLRRRGHTIEGTAGRLQCNWKTVHAHRVRWPSVSSTCPVTLGAAA